MASSEKPQSKFTEVQGIKLHYLEWGETGKAISCWCMVGPALHPDGQPSRNIFAAVFTSSRRTCAASESPIAVVREQAGERVVGGFA